MNPVILVDVGALSSLFDNAPTNLLSARAVASIQVIKLPADSRGSNAAVNNALLIKLLPDQQRSSPSQLSAIAELRNGICAIDGLQTRTAPLLSHARPRSTQNAIDWSTLLVTTAVAIPTSITSELLADSIMNWLRRHRPTGHKLVLRLGEAELHLEDASAAERQRALEIIERWIEQDGSPDT